MSMLLSFDDFTSVLFKVIIFSWAFSSKENSFQIIKGLKNTSNIRNVHFNAQLTKSIFSAKNVKSCACISKIYERGNGIANNYQFL